MLFSAWMDTLFSFWFWVPHIKYTTVVVILLFACPCHHKQHHIVNHSTVWKELWMNTCIMGKNITYDGVLKKVQEIEHKKAYWNFCYCSIPTLSFRAYLEKQTEAHPLVIFDISPLIWVDSFVNSRMCYVDTGAFPKRTWDRIRWMDPTICV